MAKKTKQKKSIKASTKKPDKSSINKKNSQKLKKKEQKSSIKKTKNNLKKIPKVLPNKTNNSTKPLSKSKKNFKSVDQVKVKAKKIPEKKIKIDIKKSTTPEIINEDQDLKKTKKTKKIAEKNNQPFKVGEYAVYPSHGIGKILEIQTNIIANQEISCYLMTFEKEKLVIKIPVNNAEKIGLRRIITKSQMEEVLNILRSGIKKLKGMWSRRAQEYETKINSGDIFLLAEVLRDLTRDIDDSERSYSERIIYETAIYRLASEYAIIYHIDIQKAQEKIINIAKDKINSEHKTKTKDDFDDFDMIDRKAKIDGEEDDDEEDEEEEEDDFNYDFNEIADDEDEDKPKKRKNN